MNHIKTVYLLMASFLITGTASAVEVARCPASISVKVDNIEPSTDADLVRNLSERNRDFLYLLDEVKAIRDELKGFDLSQVSNLTLNLVRTNNGQCGYAIDGTAAPRDTSTQDSRVSETRLFSKGGRDLLRVSLDVGGGEFVWIYLTVTDYSLAGIETKQVRAAKVMGYIDHGAASFTIGWASGISAE